MSLVRSFLLLLIPLMLTTTAQAQVAAACLPDEGLRRIQHALKWEARFDENRLEVLKDHLGFSAICAQQVGILLRTFSTDDGRLQALRLMLPAISDPYEREEILCTFDFNSTRDEARKLIDNENRARSGTLGQ